MSDKDYIEDTDDDQDLQEIEEDNDEAWDDEFLESMEYHGDETK